MRNGQPLRSVSAGALEVAYEEAGTPAATTVILLHGFPYDPRAYDEVVPALVASGLRVLVPYLRGFGPTRFLSDATPRSGQQAALGSDLLAFMDALEVERAVLAGYDWGGRAACIVAALRPERVVGLVSMAAAYNIQDIASAATPASPAQEHRLWYQFYLHGERGREGLHLNGRAFCRLLWEQWSPDWRFTEEQYATTARSFENPDFVDVVVSSYRHRFGLYTGDPALASIEADLARRPRIQVPSIVLQGESDGVSPPDRSGDDLVRDFGGLVRRSVVPRVGHNFPQEAPRAATDAVLELAFDGARRSP